MCSENEFACPALELDSGTFKLPILDLKQPKASISINLTNPLKGLEYRWESEG